MQGRRYTQLQHQSHQLHQHLVSLLSAAFPHKSTPAFGESTAAPSPNYVGTVDASSGADAGRVAALESLRRAIVKPENSSLVLPSAAYLAQGLSQLLSDRVLIVRRAAVVTYGSLCAVLCSVGQGFSSGLPEGFISWALPLLGDVDSTNGSAELAFDGVREFIIVGDAMAIERFVQPVIRAFRDLLENDQTSSSLLRRMLDILAIIGSKFKRYFHTHFVDFVDLLLGWAFMPNMSDLERGMIMDCFIQFGEHWINNLQFSTGLLLKFLDDIEALMCDLNFETSQSRFLSLISCFLTVLEVIVSGASEVHIHEQVVGSFEMATQKFLKCAMLFGRKLGWAKWWKESWKCILLLAESLNEKFSEFYETTVDVLLLSSKGVSTMELQEGLKTNIQLLSLQKAGFRPSSVKILLRFDSLLSQLRLHPNHAVVSSTAGTYIFLLQHGCDDVVSQAVDVLFKELRFLKTLVQRHLSHSENLFSLPLGSEICELGESSSGSSIGFSDQDLLSLVRFDLKILLTSIPSGASCNALRYQRAIKIVSFVCDQLSPFDAPFSDSFELQFEIFRTLRHLSEIEFLSKCAEKCNNIEKTDLFDLQVDYIQKYGAYISKALVFSMSTTLKVEALTWISGFGSLVSRMAGDDYMPCADASINNDLLFAILDLSSDRDARVRSQVAKSLEIVLLAGLIDPAAYVSLLQVVLDKLGDPEKSTRDLFIRVLSIVFPVTLHACCSTASKWYIDWRQLVHKQRPRKLHVQQLITILSYLSNRLKVPLSSWVHRFFCGDHRTKDVLLSQQEPILDPGVDDGVLDKICATNSLAAAWWSINQAAWHCISLRLRTNLGGPSQTFAALEHMLLDIPDLLVSESKQGDVRYSALSEVSLLPTRFLLDFVEALKKKIYNAYEGSYALLSTNQQSALFFRANRRVCEEWFSRIDEPMLNAALAVHCNDAILHYCSFKLLDLKNTAISVSASESFHFSCHEMLQMDVLKVLQYASLALCRLHDTDGLVGLQKWATTTFSFLNREVNSHAGVSSSPYRYSWISGLIYQACGQYEKAAAYYVHLLQSDEALSYMVSDDIHFIIARVIECYTSLSDWKCLDNWLTELQALRATHVGKPYSGAFTTADNDLNAVHALARFDEGEFSAASGYLDLTPKSSGELTLDPKVALERSEQMLLRCMIQGHEASGSMKQEIDRAKLMLNEALSVASLDGLSEVAPYAAQLHCLFAWEMGTNSDRNVRLPSEPLERIHQDCSMWMKVLRVYRAIQPSSFVTLRLYRNLHTLARRQTNFLLAHRLHEYLVNHPLTCSQEVQMELHSLHIHYESILLQYAEGEHIGALTNLWSFVCPSMLSATADSSVTDPLLKAKACLKLSTWMQRETSNTILRNILLKICADYSAHDSLGHDVDLLFMDTNLQIVLQEFVGTVAKVSCNLCPSLGKAWFSYASWCFDQAQISLSGSVSFPHPCLFSRVLESEHLADRYYLTNDETAVVGVAIRSMIHGDEVAQSFTSDKDNLISSLVKAAVLKIEAAAGVPGFEACNGEMLSSALSSDLQNLLQVHTSPKCSFPSFIDQLLGIWFSLRCRRVSLFANAAQGYFQFLSYSSLQLNEIKGKHRISTLRAALHVLHIVLNYGAELREPLESGFSAIPLSPLQDIIPQLFAGVNSHPHKVVRQLLEGLLMMIGKHSPCSLLYPTLVNLNSYEGIPSEELQRIHNLLVKLYPGLVQDVKLTIDELGKINVLWEEQWLSTLQDLHADVLMRITVLKDEAARVDANSTLTPLEKNKISSAKYCAMMAPIIVALERRLTSTSREPRTPYEIWFHKEFGDKLKSAILMLKSPPVTMTSVEDVWRPFDIIASSLAACRKKSCISLKDVAPQLANLSNSVVPMPGFERQLTLDSSGNFSGEFGVVMISSINDMVSILSTKTKPKKLVFLGSDGQQYTYLLKGHEDLRLDARIMQLLDAIDNLLSSSRDACKQYLAIRHYSVTPISARAGLIQWVDNVSSIYSVYKAWQKRSQLSQTAVMDKQIHPVPRPSDMFYRKIIPALKERGIKRVISRKDWPLEVKRSVLLELMEETPRQILSQEMWCASEGFKSFNMRTKRFTGSIAAMSIVGHVIGLGDRHLDNMLLDFQSGEVVHIDYNICFDKGRKLKIPEIVPFRLTHTIEAALGLTGYEGAFRSNCERVLSILQKNMDIILMLMEVFVWDPLMEWMHEDSQDEAGIACEERKGMELAVCLSLFSSRLQEMRVPLQEHHDLLLSILPTTESNLKKFLDVLNEYDVAYSHVLHVEKERSNLLQKEATAKSILTEATSVAEQSRSSLELQVHELAQAKSIAAEKVDELTTWVNQHGSALEALRDGSFLDALSLIGLDETLSLTSAVLVSGVPLTIVPEQTKVQCHDLDKEVLCLITELNNGLSSAVNILKEYGSILRSILPINYITTSPVCRWNEILQLSINSSSRDVLSLFRKEAVELLAEAEGDDINTVRKRCQDLCQMTENCLIDLGKLENKYSEIIVLSDSDDEAKSKERMISAFMRYIKSSSHTMNEGDSSFGHKPGDEMNFKFDGVIEDRSAKVLTVLGLAASQLYRDGRAKMVESLSKYVGLASSEANDDQHFDMFTGLFEFEKQIEKCVLVAGFICEVEEVTGRRLSDNDNDKPRHWDASFRVILCSSIHMIEQIMDVVLPEVISSFTSFNCDVMEVFVSLSQIRVSIESVLERLVEVEHELELEKSYFVNVTVIMEQQSSLEEAAFEGREQLSWEEAEELGAQEEACRNQLDQLHQSWSHKDVRSATLLKIKTNLMSLLASYLERFSLLVACEPEGTESRVSKSLLTSLSDVLCELEAADHMLPANSTLSTNLSRNQCRSVWALSSLLKNDTFFIWKFGLIYSLLDLCIHEISSLVDYNFNIDQVKSSLRKKIFVHLQEQIHLYFRERIVPALVLCLDNEIINLQKAVEGRQEVFSEQVARDSEALRRVTFMLDEYCTTQASARAARSFVPLIERQMNEFTDILNKRVLEMVQLHWMHDISLPHLLKSSILSRNVFANSHLYTVLNLGRPEFLNKIQASVSLIEKSMDYICTWEQRSVQAEEQLERAMAWACTGSGAAISGSLPKSSGIPPEFHSHLINRRKLLQTVRAQASDVVRLCTSILEFEGSKDGFFVVPGNSSDQTADRGKWQQILFASVSRLDGAYHSFKRAEQDMEKAQHTVEAASREFLTASTQLSVASVKAKSVLGDLQKLLSTMHDCARNTGKVLSEFSGVMKFHTALTSECGSMLDEILAVTEGLHDASGLGKDAAETHGALMANLSKVNEILHPLETSLSTDLAVLGNAILRERDGERDGSVANVSLLHGKALHQSYNCKIRDACEALSLLIPSVTRCATELHSLLTKLGHISSIRSGNLCKVLEVAGSQTVSFQEASVPKSQLLVNISFEKEGRSSENKQEDSSQYLITNSDSHLQDENWISPIEDMYNSSDQCSILSQINFPGDDSTDEINNKGTTGDKVAFLHENLEIPAMCGSDSHTTENVGDGPDSHGLFVTYDHKAIENIDAHKHFSDSAMPGKKDKRSKNSIAVSVMKHVEQKLNGQDIDPTGSLTVSEHVDYLINQATSIDNLCNMYEGWTPWI